jgi:hypothetical protein
MICLGIFQSELICTLVEARRSLVEFLAFGHLKQTAKSFATMTTTSNSLSKYKINLQIDESVVIYLRTPGSRTGKRSVLKSLRDQERSLGNSMSWLIWVIRDIFG